jgi:hypothetical protein
MKKFYFLVASLAILLSACMAVAPIETAPVVATATLPPTALPTLEIGDIKLETPVVQEDEVQISGEYKEGAGCDIPVSDAASIPLSSGKYATVTNGSGDVTYYCMDGVRFEIAGGHDFDKLIAALDKKAMAEEEQSTNSGADVDYGVSGENFPLDFEAEVYWSPFRDTTDTLADEATHPYFAEPGNFPGQKMADGEWSQTAWDRMSDSEEYLLVPEGGGLYIAWGGGCLAYVDPEDSAEGKEVRKLIGCLPKAPERIYLTFIRGLPADDLDPDRNTVVVAFDYVRGAGISHIMPVGAYWSLDWTLDQIDNAYEPRDGNEWPNCGDNGCDDLLVPVIDLDSSLIRIWKIGPGLRDWTRIESLDSLQLE